MSHILERARALFFERGFARTTMDEVTERLNISKLFIYKFFDNKHALLVALYDRELRDSLQVIETRCSIADRPKNVSSISSRSPAATIS